MQLKFPTYLPSQHIRNRPCSEEAARSAISSSIPSRISFLPYLPYLTLPYFSYLFDKNGHPELTTALSAVLSTLRA
jgi:hypothetical protein